MINANNFLNTGRPLRVVSSGYTGIDNSSTFNVTITPAADQFVYFNVGGGGGGTLNILVGGRTFFNDPNSFNFLGSAGTNNQLATQGGPFFPGGKGEQVVITRAGGFTNFTPVNFMILEEDT